MTKKIVFVLPTVPKTRHLAVMPTHLFRIISCLPSDVHAEVLDMSMHYGIALNSQGEKKVLAKLVADLDQRVDARDTVVGFSCISTHQILASLPLAKIVKERYGAITVLGGYAPSSCPQILLEDYGDLFDYILVGRSEESCARLMENFSDGALTEESVPNLVRRVDGRVVFNKSAPPMPLSELPRLDMSSLAYIHLYPYIVYNTSVGCPYHCSFCLESVVNPVYSQRKTAQIIQDLNHIHALCGQRAMAFYDANFGVRRDLRRLLQLLAEAGFDYGVEMRIDMLNEELLQLLSGRCKVLFIGLESLSEQSLALMRKSGSIEKYVNRVYKVLPRCFELGIPVMLALLPNYPLNQDKDAQACLEFCQAIRKVYMHSGARSGLIFSPTHVKIYYGTKLYSELAALTKQGVRVRPGLPSTYAGWPVRKELVQVVADASPTLPEEKYLEYELEIRSQSVFPKDYSAFLAIARLNLDMTLLKEGKLSADYYSDEDRDVIQVASVIARLDEYLAETGLSTGLVQLDG